MTLLCFGMPVLVYVFNTGCSRLLLDPPRPYDRPTPTPYNSPLCLRRRTGAEDKLGLRVASKASFPGSAKIHSYDTFPVLGSSVLPQQWERQAL